MGIFNLFGKKTKEVKTDSHFNEVSFINGAEHTALIVEDSIKKGEISDLSDRIQEYIALINTRERVVFGVLPEANIWKACIAICLVLTIGFLIMLPIAFGTLLYSTSYKNYGLMGIGIIAVISIINIWICRKAAQEIRFTMRYDQYENILKYKNFELVDDLADMIRIDRSTVEKDLQKAVDYKLIPQGRFGNDNLFFMVTEDAFKKYSENKAAYDRYFKQVIEERSRISERSEEIEELLYQGKERIGKIHDYNEIIKDKDVSLKLDRMEKIVAAIFHEVDINPNQAKKLNTFMNYYLPTTEKLLESYIDINEKQVKGDGLQQVQKDIVRALDSINDAYENLLEKFYEEQELDISSDISVMETIMKQKGDI